MAPYNLLSGMFEENKIVRRLKGEDDILHNDNEYLYRLGFHDENGEPIDLQEDEQIEDNRSAVERYRERNQGVGPTQYSDREPWYAPAGLRTETIPLPPPVVSVLQPDEKVQRYVETSVNLNENERTTSYQMRWSYKGQIFESQKDAYQAAFYESVDVAVTEDMEITEDIARQLLERTHYGVSYHLSMLNENDRRQGVNRILDSFKQGLYIDTYYIDYDIQCMDLKATIRKATWAMQFNIHAH